MKEKKSDITIVGAGVVGLAAALLSAQKNFSVNVVDLKSPPKSLEGLPQQARTIALNQATLSMLDQLDVWKIIDKTRLGFMDGMRVIDGQGQFFEMAPEQSNDTLSVVIEYQHLQYALVQACMQYKNITFYFDSQVESIYQEEGGIALRINPDCYLESKVLIGADGSNSWLSGYLKLPKVNRDYHHTACIGLASSEKGLDNLALQTCDEDFILGILPLSDPHCHSVIFSCSEKKKSELMEAEKSLQNCILTNAAQNELGFMQWQTPIVPIPLIRHHLERYTADRIVMIGDAAHRIHPMAGQGANMGFSDAMALVACFGQAEKNGKDIGSTRVLKQFELGQKPKNDMLLKLHDLLKEGLTDSSVLLNISRGIGFKVLDKSGLLKKFIKTVVN
jgi:2-octaprenylphenol hydroxylase